MRTPVIIAAYNEEKFLPTCLKKLDASVVEPIVVANGCSDATAAVAESFGATTYALPEAGKLPAIQHALKQLSKRALEPVLFLDADSHPLTTRAW